MTSYADSAAFLLTIVGVCNLVVCYLLASFCENIDGDWLLRICASVLLMKEKEKK